MLRYPRRNFPAERVHAVPEAHVVAVSSADLGIAKLASTNSLTGTLRFDR